MICLDWSGSEHWSHTPAPCRWCGRPTHLLDDAGRPAHKLCVEKVLTDAMNDRSFAGHRKAKRRPANLGMTPPKRTGASGASGSTGTPLEHRGDVDECSSCTAPLLLKVAGRTVCERCRIAAARAAS